MSAQLTLLVLLRLFVFTLQSVLPLPPEKGERGEGEKRGSPKAQAEQVARDPLGGLTISREPVREWKDCLNNSMRGRLLGIYGATVFLTVEGHEDDVFPLAYLRIEDRDYIRSRLRALKKETLFPGAADPSDDAAKLRLTEPQWQKQLDQWVKAADADKSSDFAAAEVAWNHLRCITDPNAVQYLTALINRKLPMSIRMACIESLARIGNQDAMQFLVKLASSDRDGQLRASATWALCCLPDPRGVLAEYATYLRSEEVRGPALLSLLATGLVQPLQSNQVPDRQLTETLIGILVVKEARYVPYYVWKGYDTGWMPHAFGGGGERHAHFHLRTGIAKFDVPVPCELARKMLVYYSGQDYGYDRQSWRRWQTAQTAKKPAAENANNQQ